MGKVKESKNGDTWNYQVFCVVSKSEKHPPYYCIKEVYRGVTGINWTLDEIAPIGDTKEDVIAILTMMLKDAKYYEVHTEYVD